jgi:hypothetical protein
MCEIASTLCLLSGGSSLSFAIIITKLSISLNVCLNINVLMLITIDVIREFF